MSRNPTQTVCRAEAHTHAEGAVHTAECSGLCSNGAHLPFVLQKQLHGFTITEQPFPLQREPESRVKATSPKSPSAALNDSLVECPKCSVQYPATEHRDLLVHVEYCMK